jgi:hypothetical protein
MIGFLPLTLTGLVDINPQANEYYQCQQEKHI